MNINPSSIARDQLASRLKFSSNLTCAPRKTIGFCTPDAKFRRTMQNVNHNHATTSMVTSADPLGQNSKIPERHTISHRETSNRERKTQASAFRVPSTLNPQLSPT